MRCEETRELIHAGYSRYLRHPSLEGEGEVLAQAVDLHLEGCMDCRGTVIASRWQEWRSRPGPLALVHTHSRIRHLRERPVTNVESTPIVRIVNNLLVMAIHRQVSDILLVPCMKGSVGYPIRRSHAQSISLNAPAIVQEIKQALGEYQSKLRAWQEDDPVEKPHWAIGYLIDGSWSEEMKLPPFVVSGIRVRFKDMAELKVQSTGIHQAGHIPIRYMGLDYDVYVFIEPHPLGESIHLSIARVEQLAA